MGNLLDDVPAQPRKSKLKWKIREVFRRQEDAYAAILTLSSRDKLDPDSLRDALSTSRLPIKSESEQRFRELLLWFNGPPADLADSLSWRLACTYDHLVEGGRIEPVFVPRLLDTALQVINVGYERHSKKGFPLLGIKFRVLSGPFGGLCFKQLMPCKWARAKLGKDIGPFGYRLPDARELGGFVLIGKVQFGSEESRLLELIPSSTCRSFNSFLLYARSQPCPLGCIHPCYVCPIGADNGGCRGVVVRGSVSMVPTRPVHLVTFVKRKCHTCGEEQLADPECDSRMCYKCQERALEVWKGD